MANVFCGKCKHFEIWGGLYFCKHPDNNIIKRNWREKWNSNIKKPEIINKRNKCKWFEEGINCANDKNCNALYYGQKNRRK